MDSTRLDVFAFDPLTLRWVQAELSIGMDWYTRCVTGIRLTPVSKKAVDESAVLYPVVPATASGAGLAKTCGLAQARAPQDGAGRRRRGRRPAGSRPPIAG